LVSSLPAHPCHSNPPGAVQDQSLASPSSQPPPAVKQPSQTGEAEAVRGRHQTRGRKDSAGSWEMVDDRGVEMSRRRVGQGGRACNLQGVLDVSLLSLFSPSSSRLTSFPAALNSFAPKPPTHQTPSRVPQPRPPPNSVTPLAALPPRPSPAPSNSTGKPPLKRRKRVLATDQELQEWSEGGAVRQAHSVKGKERAVKESLGDDAKQGALLQPDKGTFAFLYLGRPC
jgi:hypothetical protein